MIVEQGDYLVLQYPGGNDEVYRIEYHVFGNSYISDDERNPNSFTTRIAVIAVTVTVTVTVVAILLGLFLRK